ncbi:MAG TPA: FimV/HubP family polar landmark protein [Burkholderiales bacterium]|nr:FimV/HubP family polar landmark protein [Burkholderiales bacterium]
MGSFTAKHGWLAVACALAPGYACAAGLGKITVQSALGQPLRAEIEVVSLQQGEADSLNAKLAAIAAFRQADIEFNPVLQSVKFTVEPRPGGKLVVLMSSTQPINEPYVDMLVEVNWASGRLLREYTFLLDPPEYRAPTLTAAKQPSAAPAAAPAPAPMAAAPAPQAPAAQAAAPAESAPAAPAESTAQSEPKEPAQGGEPAAPGETTAQPAAEAPKAPEEHELASEAKPAATYEVKRGDTLSKIALRNKVDGLTLQQMLVALFRANQEAFVGDNMNRLRAGKIITIPDKEEMAAVGTGDARRFVSAQMADFNDYRRSLGLAVAEAPARADAGRQAGGKIGSPGEQQAAAPKEPAKDQLRLSSGDAKAGGNAAAVAAADDAAAKDKALKEANERVAMLEKNVADMQRLLALKSGAGAQAQQQAEAAKAAAPAPAAKAAPAPAAKAAPAPVPAPVVAAQPAPAPAPAAAKAPDPAPAAKSAPTQVAQATPPGAAPKVPEAPKAPEAAKAPEAPKVAAAPKAAPKAAPPSAPAPDLVDELLANDYTIPGGAGLAVVLLGYAAYAWRKKKREAGAATELSGAPSSDANSVFGTSGGQSIDTGSSSFQSDFSQSGIGKIDTEEIDPIAEADVYMAYGRDAQAEEILKEALAKDSGRPAIRLKLLEIYANRKDTRAFQDSVGELQSITGGQGPEWDKAMSLGRGIDPQNAMYGGAGAPEVTTPDLAAAPAAPMMPDLVLPSTETPAAALDFNLDLGSGTPAEQTPDIALDAEPMAAAAPGGLDFDLGLGGDRPAQEQSDFSPGGTLIIDSPFAPEAAPAGADAPLNFDLELPAAAPAPIAAPAAPVAAASAGGDGMIEFDLGGLPGAAPEPQAEPAKAPAIDLSAIDLDIGAEPAAEAPSGGAPDPRWQEVATKLDLAKAYDEMGDKDGARELLKEVVKEGDTAQQQRAQSMLQTLGAA